MPHPTIITESGRHRRLSQRADLQRAGRFRAGRRRRAAGVARDPEQLLIDLAETLRSVNSRNLLEAYHDSQQALDSALNLFSLLSAARPAMHRGESFWTICRRIQKMSRDMEFFPKSWKASTPCCLDTYFCNFSLFQSMPDSWAIKQLFPVMPIHRFNEKTDA